MQQALAMHDGILRKTIEAHEGHVFKTVGDAFCAAFSEAQQALTAGIKIQQILLTTEWPEEVAIKVRMGLHTGEAEKRDNDYFGTTVNVASRVSDLAKGTEILVTEEIFGEPGVQAIAVDHVVEPFRTDIAGLDRQIAGYRIRSSDV